MLPTAKRGRRTSLFEAVLVFEIAGVRGNLVEVKCVGHNRLHRHSVEGMYGTLPSFVYV